MRPVDERARLAVVEALERDGVDLDLQPRGGRGVDPLHDGRVVAPAGHRAELVGVERVERDVDPPDAAVGELVGVARELRAVGGQRDLVERAAVEVTPEAAEQRHHVAPDERLAAGDPQLARPRRRRRPSTGGRAPRATGCPAWAGNSCPRTCNRRSGSRSGPSPRPAHRRCGGRTGRRGAPPAECIVVHMRRYIVAPTRERKAPAAPRERRAPSIAISG